MSRYEHDEQDEQEPAVEYDSLLFEAGYGKALEDARYANSSDAVGDRILEASRKMHGAGMWQDHDADADADWLLDAEDDES